MDETPKIDLPLDGVLDEASAKELFDTLMGLPAPETVAASEAINRLGLLVDLSDDFDSAAGNDRALAWAEVINGWELTDGDRVLLHYFWANAWAGRQHRLHHDLNAVWAWEQLEVSQQILNLRMALGSPAFHSLEKVRQCQILTNLANQLNTTGRFVEALEFWAKALAIDPHFWMAQGNRAYALMHYARCLYDDGHRGVFFVAARDGFVDAVANERTFDPGGHPHAAAQFAAMQADLDAGLDIEGLRADIDLKGHSLGRGKTEVAYRRWALRERLFLNPLNDLGADPIAANDVLNLPTFRLPIHEPPEVVGLYNQMKQEFASARWLLYEALQDSGPHLSDRGVLLLNTLDYPAYSLAVEKLKFAFRAAYSIFDKIGFFLNHYLQLGEKPGAIDFKRVWKQKDGTIRPAFAGTRNLPFRGLYWLSKDLFEERGDILEPDVRALKNLRNHLEHRYVKVHDMTPTPRPGVVGDIFTDTLALSIGRSDFQAKTLRVLKLARAALTYLSLGMHMEEIRREGADSHTVAGPMFFTTVRDDWKW
ncbi:MAG: hypothetical protein GC145_07895 [Caulobacter sp.]|nr:hypothetical protein [Caulobacter sp.]